jgi:hypothetical protein
MKKISGFLPVFILDNGNVVCGPSVSAELACAVNAQPILSPAAVVPIEVSIPDDVKRVDGSDFLAAARAQATTAALGMFHFVAKPKAERDDAAHADDRAVDRFAEAMKAKLAAAREKGRGGWQDDEDGMQEQLSDLLRMHVEKGDPVDVANFAMFLHQRGEAVLPPYGVPFDMLAHLARQREWSGRTFGPGARTQGVVDHIRKELNEIESAPGDVSEWIDVAILAFDGAWRAGFTPQQIVDALVAKQTKNEGRTWPDWRTMPADKAIEHDRSTDVAAPAEA